MSGQSSSQQTTESSTNAFKSRFGRYMSRIGTVGKGLKTGVNIFIIGSLALYTWDAFMKKRKYLTIHDDTTVTWRLEQLGVNETTLDSGDLISTLSSGTVPKISFLDALKTLRWMRDDDRVTALIMDFSSTGLGSRTPLGLGQIQELRNAILQLKETKKQKFGQGIFKMQAIADTFDSQTDYYLASAFDEIFMEPIGQVPLYGLSSVGLFFKNMLDKVGIKFTGYSVGEFKSVLKPYTETQYPTPIRENTETLLASINEQIINGVAKTRCQQLIRNSSLVNDELELKTPEITSSEKTKNSNHVEQEENMDKIPLDIPVTAAEKVLTRPASTPATLLHAKSMPITPSNMEIEKIKHFMDMAPLSASEAESVGLIDGIYYKRQLYEPFWPISAPYNRKLRQSASIPVMNFERYAIARRNEKVRQDKRNNAAALLAEVPNEVVNRPIVALVYVIGMIKRGDSQFGSNTIVRAITDAARDTEVKAIVLRIDSNGGDAIASETIWEAVESAQKTYNKPVVASFANIAASGGYYIATPAVKILCNPGTITGSIGVAAGRPVVLPELLNKLGISTEQIAFSESSKANSIFKDLNGLNLKRFIKQVDQIYKVFNMRVANGRRMSFEDVEKAARGRVWSGVDALKVGLVDEIGGIERAIQVATKCGYHLETASSPTSTFINPEAEIRIYPRPKALLEKLLGSNTFDEAAQVLKEELSNFGMKLFKSLFREQIKEMVVSEFGIDRLNGDIRLECDLDLN